MQRLKFRKINRRVMIDCLYAEGVRWAGWYRQENLEKKFDEVTGRCLQGSHGRKFEVIHTDAYLAEGGSRPVRRKIRK